MSQRQPSNILLVLILFFSRVLGFQQPSLHVTRCGSLSMHAMCPEIPLTPRPGTEIAIVACGWFWGPQPEFQSIRGVYRCLVGYSGGVEPNPSYDEMKDFTESVFIEFDPSQVSYAAILNKWKLISTPYETTRQYRTAVFYLSEEQKEVARIMCDGMSHVDVEPATKFFMAEERHQNFLARL